jgi:type I restriction enzyme M protein
MWNQDNYDEAFYDSDKWSRFEYGNPPRSSADWGWAQHMFASLNDTGRAAIVLDTGAVSRGSGSKSSNKEKEIRKTFVENDFVEGVILLPDNLFYNTTAPGIILVLNRNKATNRKSQFLLANASAYFVKHKPKNVLTEDGIAAVADVFGRWETKEKLSRVITLDDARAADYNLSPSQFVEVEERRSHRPLKDILEDLAVAKVERERADKALGEVLSNIVLNELR